MKGCYFTLSFSIMINNKSIVCLFFLNIKCSTLLSEYNILFLLKSLKMAIFLERKMQVIYSALCFPDLVIHAATAHFTDAGYPNQPTLISSQPGSAP